MHLVSCTNTHRDVTDLMLTILQVQLVSHTLLKIALPDIHIYEILTRV